MHTAIDRALLRLPVESPPAGSWAQTGSNALVSLLSAGLTFWTGKRLGPPRHTLATVIHLSTIITAQVTAQWHQTHLEALEGEVRGDIPTLLRVTLCGMSFGAMGLTLSKWSKTCWLQKAAFALSLGDFIAWQVRR